MEKIIIAKQVVEYIESLTITLFKKEYFGFESSAISYISNIYDFIYSELATSKSKATPKRLKKYGANYVVYKTTKRTAWYVFFDKKDNRYYIQYK
jgi:hypothetical protein